MLTIENYHTYSQKQEKDLAEEILPYLSLLLLDLNNLPKLNKQSINEIFSNWHVENESKIINIITQQVNNLDKYTDKEILATSVKGLIIPIKPISSDIILPSSEISVPESTIAKPTIIDIVSLISNNIQKYFELTATNTNKIKLITATAEMLDITVGYVYYKFLELAILENNYQYPFDKSNEFLQQVVNTTENKVDFFATMSTIANMHSLIKEKVIQTGYTEYQWQTCEDNRVRELHRKMNKRWLLLSDLSPMPAGCQPGVDWGCRCWMNKFR